MAVAVLDSGVAYEDYTDPRTGQVVPQGARLGQTPSFLPGYDFVNGDAHPNDDEYHGTHVASTIAEATNNGIGVAGLAFGCAIMPVKVLDAARRGHLLRRGRGHRLRRRATRRAAQKPVKVINLSLGSEGFSQTVKTAIDRARRRRRPGRGRGRATPARAVVDFPANLPNVLAVGALDARKERASYSNTGAGPRLRGARRRLRPRRQRGRRSATACSSRCPTPTSSSMGRHDQFCYCGLDGTSMATPARGGGGGAPLLAGLHRRAPRCARRSSRRRSGWAARRPTAATTRTATASSGPRTALPGLGLNVGPKK